MPISLSQDDREFFGLIHQAAFINPFSIERTDVDARIAASGPESTRAEVLSTMLTQLWIRLHRLGERRSSDFAGKDAELYETAALFSTFHRYSPEIDAHIKAQLSAGTKAIVFDAGKTMMTELIQQGFPDARAQRLLSLFFQMRRAFFFIAQSLIGESESMGKLREQLWTNVFTHDALLYERVLWNRMEDFSTFMVGETGTGKGAAAAAIGRSGYIPYNASSMRFEHSFVSAFNSVNLSQFSENLIESELFGHKKGAFTGAIESHNGVFQRCQELGAIFLDEIGDVSAPIQIKLLRVLQDRVYSPVGGHEELKFSGRVIAATNRPVDELRAEGKFRDDFFYRLCSDVIEVPTLRRRVQENPNELELMVEVLVKRIVGAEHPGIVDQVMSAVAALGPYAWPGNVRELEQCIRRVILTRQYTPAASQRPNGLAERFEAAEMTADELLGEYCSLLYARLGSYEEVGKRVGLDRRTVRKHVVGNAD